ncbi:unnamed protein product [Cylicostephanus goldi]|uniref:Condensin II complex subunit H2 N-terminal domain-containing protein n=1 Tax=Cylicostephanus goldi TaxID=71465 RepID=A0A3P6RZI0_CYLGO|nr:unnamed protein product [Cylicostephanus goldi]
MGDEFEGAGQRYAFLLRPLKDLGKNFEIDIAKELDDYCQQLKDVAEDQENDVNNEHRFNFAEAAMLIQGSAFVFGRKVDYVHSQAVHFFEALQSHKTKKKKKGLFTGDTCLANPGKTTHCMVPKIVFGCPFTIL